MGICITFACFQTLRSRKRGFLHEKGFLAPLSFPRPHQWSSVHKKDRLKANQRASIWTTKLEIEANAVIYTHTYMHIYIQVSSKADVIGHRQPSLVTCATLRPGLVCCEAWWLRSDYMALCLRDWKQVQNK